MTPGRRGFRIAIGIMLCAAYATLWHHAWSTKHALDPAMPEGGQERGSVMVSYLFHPEDCPDASEFISTLNELAAQGQDVQGMMIAPRRAESDIAEVAEAYRIRFPVRPVSVREAGLLLGALRHERSPLAIVRDSSGMIRMLIPGRAAAPTASEIVGLIGR